VCSSDLSEQNKPDPTPNSKSAGGIRWKNIRF